FVENFPPLPANRVIFRLRHLPTVRVCVIRRSEFLVCGRGVRRRRVVLRTDRAPGHEARHTDKYCGSSMKGSHGLVHLMMAPTKLICSARRRSRAATRD